MSPVGRLFFEIGGDTSRLNASIREAIKTAEEAGVKITRAGQSFIVLTTMFNKRQNLDKIIRQQVEDFFGPSLVLESVIHRYVGVAEATA